MATGRQHWVWVTSPEFYLDADGGESEDLEAGSVLDPEFDWWTCHKDTEAGDLVLLYRTSPRSDIGYLWEARSRARVLDESDSDFAGHYVCDWAFRFKFSRPVTFQEMKADPLLKRDWGALRGSFQRSYYRIPSAVWLHLMQGMAAENSGLTEVLAKLARNRLSTDIRSEKELENRLRGSLAALLPSRRLDLYVHPDGRDGQQFYCRGLGGLIDLLCVDRRGNFVVVELKAGRAGQRVVGQITSYMGWVKQNLAGRKKVSGVIVSKGVDKKLKYALADMPRVEHVDVRELGL